MPVLERTKQNLLYLRCAPQNIKESWEERRTRQRQKTGMDPAQAELSHSRDHFSFPCLSPGVGRSENKNVYHPACGDFSTMQHTVDNSAPLFILTVSFTLPFRDSVAPSFPNTMLSAHKLRHSKGPIGLHAVRIEEMGNRRV